jgi:hypothetical protein
MCGICGSVALDEARIENLNSDFTIYANPAAALAPPP